jgi:hypothetical protein
MNVLDCAFLNYILDKRPSFQRMVNNHRNIIFEDENVRDIIDFILTELSQKWRDELIPTRETLRTLLGQNHKEIGRTTGIPLKTIY